MQTVINCINVKILIMIIQRFHTILIFKSKVRMKLRCCSESLSHKKHVDRQLVGRDPYCSNTSTYVLPPIILAHREKESIVFWCC